MVAEQQQNDGLKQQALIAFLARSILFGGWPESDLRTIASWLRPHDVVAGTIICREGDIGTEMYLIESGQVQVMPDHGRYIYDHLGPGAFFGEIALLGHERRTATVMMTLPGRLWSLSKSAFDQLLAARPHLQQPLQQLAATRLRAHDQNPAGAADGAAVPSGASVAELANDRQAISIPPDKTTLLIGRHDTCDVQIRDPQVSRFHARIDRQGPDAATITDLGSANGVYLNKVRITPHQSYPLENGSELWIGSNPFRFDAMEIVQFVRTAGVKVDAYHLTRVVGKGNKALRILNDISLSIQPGEFVTIVGGSGAGKSTLLNALTGFVPATEGRIFLNGIDYYQHFDLFRSSLGYVPQDDIIHKQLTVYQVLDFAAQLRLPPDTSRSERKELVEQALSQLQLTERRDTQVSQLSGGQRKRVSIGVELLNQPGLFFLDEPTSGLDPGLEETMMYLFRDLSRQGRTVVVITHATKNIKICDKVIFLARGGYLAFYGTPDEALQYFGVEDFTGIYRRLEQEASPPEWGQRFAQTSLYQRHIVEQLNAQVAAQAVQQSAPAVQPVKRKSTSSVRQFGVLVARYLAVLRRDRALLALFLLQPILISIAVTGIFQRDVFAVDPLKAVNLLFIVVVSSVFIGTMSAAREITKEVPIYIRERLVNLKILPYVSSKVLILALLSLVQAAVFLLIVMLRIDFPETDLRTMLHLLATLYLVYLGGMAMGLVISAFVANEDRAAGFVPLVVIPQMTLGGAIIAIKTIPKPGQYVSTLAVSRWGFENLGSITQLNEKINAVVAQRPGLTNEFDQAFSHSLRSHYAILALIIAVLLVATTVLVKRKDIR